MVAQIKKNRKTKSIYLKFCFWEDPLHPVNWSPTHSTGPLICFLLNFRACSFIGFPFVYHYFWGRVICQLDIFLLHIAKPAPPLGEEEEQPEMKYSPTAGRHLHFPSHKFGNKPTPPLSQCLTKTFIGRDQLNNADPR